jgi:hypothetical protein
MADEIVIENAVSAPQPPTAYYLSKVFYERRIKTASMPAWVALDTIRVNVQNRPADWSTTTTEPWPTYLALDATFVSDVCDYILSDSVNILDPAQAAMLGLLQATDQVFGSDTDVADTLIAQILNPAPAPGEQ